MLYQLYQLYHFPGCEPATRAVTTLIGTEKGRKGESHGMPVNLPEQSDITNPRQVCAPGGV